MGGVNYTPVFTYACTLAALQQRGHFYRIYLQRRPQKGAFQKPVIMGFHYLGNGFCDFAY